MQETGDASISVHAAEKGEYMKSLKQNIAKLASDSNTKVFGVFEKIRDVIPGEMVQNSNSAVIESALQSDAQFIDSEYPPVEENLQHLKRDNMKYISWFCIKDFFPDQKYCLFNNIKLRSQIMRDKGFSYLVDALLGSFGELEQPDDQSGLGGHDVEGIHEIAEPFIAHNL